MKKLVTSLLLTFAVSSSFAASDLEKMVLTGSTFAGPFLSLIHPLAGGAVLTTAVYAFDEVGFKYEGLENDAIEVLAGSIELEESLVLTMFKEDVIANKATVEAGLKADNINVEVEDLTDVELAQLALAFSVQK
ncbi:MAG: hypothetical protein KC478_15095 [Bacteriovoracaceae bacterium]|nr:hypothetical protein [Bacteriovoracaceae bacterium]